MDIAGVKAWLGRYRKMMQRLDTLPDAIAYWQSRAEKITPDIRAEPTGGGGGASQSMALATETKVMCELEQLEIEGSIGKVKAEVTEAIKSLPTERDRVLMKRYYLDRMSWREIAVTMGYSIAQVHRYHRKNLEFLKDDSNDSGDI